MSGKGNNEHPECSALPNTGLFAQKLVTNISSAPLFSQSRFCTPYLDVSFSLNDPARNGVPKTCFHPQKYLLSIIFWGFSAICGWVGGREEGRSALSPTSFVPVPLFLFCFLSNPLRARELVESLLYPSPSLPPSVPISFCHIFAPETGCDF